MPRAERTRDHTPGNWVEICWPRSSKRPMVTDLGVIEETDGRTLIYQRIVDGTRRQAPSAYCTTVPSPSEILACTAELRRVWSAARRDWSRVMDNPPAITWEY